MDPSYRSVVEDSQKWLMPTMGSEIPEHLTPIRIEKYAPVFEVEDDGIVLGNPESAKLDLIGQGSYAIVHKYIDPNYGIPIARKKLRKDADQKEIRRFRQEYEFMKRCDFPYILKVFKYDESDNSYTMEYCDYTLKDYIFRNNGTLRFPLRRKMALEFLYAVNYLHAKKIWHRDLSYNNVLIHTYSNDGVFEVKLSDFGLAKGPDSDLTSTGSDMKGTIVDPALDSFRDFGPVNDIYAVGFILNYIFTGKRNLVIDEFAISKIVRKCSNTNPSLRYQSVREIIVAVQQLTSAIAVE